MGEEGAGQAPDGVKCGVTELRRNGMTELWRMSI